MYEIAIRQHFDAAHALREYHGKCENLHGHRYQVDVFVKSETLNHIGLAYDFTELKAALKELLFNYDHHYLNEIGPFDQINPSAENIARTIFEVLAEKLRGHDATLEKVRVYESP